MTSNEQYIKEFEDDFLTNPRRKIAYLNGDEKRELIGFLLNCFDKKDKEWKEESLIEVEINDGSKKKVELKEAIELIKKDIEALRSNFK